MALLHTPAGALGAPAPDFTLHDPQGAPVSLSDARGPHGLVAAFICNHCPYVQAVIDRFVADAAALQDAGIGVVAVMPNDYKAYPEDAPGPMAVFATRHAFRFPYLVDETQDVARAYGAVCTPDFFGYDADLQLVYRGRLDAAGPHAATPDTPRELLQAMRAVAAGQNAPAVQHPSMGCSIKWRQGV